MDKCREEFEQHFLSLPFSNSETAQKCLDACDFDVKQNAFIPNVKWFNNNDVDEGVIYCCMLNTAYMSFQKQQAKVEELQVQLKGTEERAQLILQYKDKYRLERDELQKRVDKAIEALKNKIEKVQKYEQDSFDHGAVIGLDSALRTVEQALKGEGCQ
ncbi:hypothetical protein [Acinetobacter baumannii]|uniref:hypothetical protein n=1 Tax=Acinetobacter baumannii TaxID=470 RepID=UPI002941059B|nr:hypothetical protein [Acinetobacter baumannii]MDV4325460.1 hypothetical protein [Acinetobacter baumannii]